MQVFVPTFKCILPVYMLLVFAVVLFARRASLQLFYTLAFWFFAAVLNSASVEAIVIVRAHQGTAGE